MSTQTTWEHLKNLEDWVSILSFEPVSLQELARKFGENPPYSPDGANYVCEAATQMRSESIHVPAEWCKRQGPGARHLDAYWFTAVFQNRLKKKKIDAPVLLGYLKRTVPEASTSSWNMDLQSSRSKILYLYIFKLQ